MEPPENESHEHSETATPGVLDREEYVEQAYFFGALGERMQQNVATQDALNTIRGEILATTRLPHAIEFLTSELRLKGVFATAMARMSHYFTAFQTYIISEAEDEEGRFDFNVALKILEEEASYRAKGATPQGVFLFQFESLCRNRLNYDRGLQAIAADPIFNDDWSKWILDARRQIGIVDVADLIYIASLYYQRHGGPGGRPRADVSKPALFGEKEGKIALANRRRDPLYLFSALARHLNYPRVPRPKPADETRTLLPGLVRRMERLESRLRLVEEEQRGGIDLDRYFGKKGEPTEPELD